MIEPLGTIRYGELVVILYAAPVVLLIALLTSAARRHRNDRTAPNG